MSISPSGVTQDSGGKPNHHDPDALGSVHVQLSWPKRVQSERVAKMICLLAEYYYSSRKSLSMKGIKGAPDWFGYESALSQLSEHVRAHLEARRNLRGQSPVLDAVATVVSDSRFGKGRQNFVLLLGEFGATNYAQAIGHALSDRELAGHAVKAALRARIPGLEHAISKVAAETTQSWVKSACVRYLAKRLSDAT